MRKSYKRKCGDSDFLAGQTNFMNRYLLVVSPGLERLLISEIKSLVARINEKVNHIVLIKGGAELDCIHDR